MAWVSEADPWTLNTGPWAGTRATRRSAHRRRGMMYAAVLGCAMLVTVIGLSALMALRVERRFAEGTADFAQARLYARSAVEMGFDRITRHSNWRQNYPSGVWEADQPIGTGTYTLEGVDPVDNDLRYLNADPVMLTGTGVEGNARYKLQVTLVGESLPLGCLEVALHAGNDLNFNNSIVVGDQTISANNSVTESGSTVSPDVEAVNSISGSGYTGTTTTGIAPRSMPDPVTVFDYYIDNGTEITVPGYLIENQLLSPTTNPYGPTDPQGIYVVDCQTQNFTIRETRIVGTLVLLHAGAGSEITPQVNLEPAVSNFPVLLVEGSFTVNTGATALSESSAGVNFNPPGTPYAGSEDSLIDDSYPAVVKGLVYVSVDLVTNTNSAFEGVVVVGNTFTGPDNVTVNYGSAAHTNPPPGFAEPPQMLISSGTWRRVVD